MTNFEVNPGNPSLGQAMNGQLTEGEKRQLKGFMRRQGDSLADDMTLFSDREQKRLRFVRWGVDNGVFKP